MNESLSSDGLPEDYVTQIVALHADYYPQHWGFTDVFLHRVRTQAQAFVDHFDPQRDLVARICVDGRIAAAITIDGNTGTAGLAHLRWFIVAQVLRGQGIGTQLMTAATRFCMHRRYSRVFLDTFAGLDPARHLYEKFGFVLCDSKPGVSWGTAVIEQRFERVFAYRA